MRVFEGLVDGTAPERQILTAWLDYLCLGADLVILNLDRRGTRIGGTIAFYFGVPEISIR